MSAFGRSNTSRVCYWGIYHKRCHEKATEIVDRPKTRSYYCSHHAEEARRIYRGSGR